MFNLCISSENSKPVFYELITKALTSKMLMVISAKMRPCRFRTVQHSFVQRVSRMVSNADTKHCGTFIALLLNIQEVHCSNLGQEIGYPDWGILCFLNSLCECFGITLNRTQPLPSTSLMINLSFGAWRNNLEVRVFKQTKEHTHVLSDMLSRSSVLFVECFILQGLRSPAKFWIG
jgi:hypothetical protein